VYLLFGLLLGLLRLFVLPDPAVLRVPSGGRGGHGDALRRHGGSSAAVAARGSLSAFPVRSAREGEAAREGKGSGRA